MTVKLTANFFKNARGITLKDTASATWSINSNTNEISVATGGGTVGSVGLTDGSTTPIYSISGSPVTGSGTLTFTFKTQSANTVLAGPTTGAAAQPAFRALVAADVPSSILPGSFSGFANPTASVGLAAVNGAATTAMRSDAAPALDVTIAPTWSGFHQFAHAGEALQVNSGSFAGFTGQGQLLHLFGSGGTHFGCLQNDANDTWSLGWTSAASTALGTGVIQWNASSNVTFTNAALSKGSGGVGYTTGAGGTVTQLTSRTTAVTINKTCGSITLFSAAGSATATTFTVNNNTVAATDTIVVNGKSGTNIYLTWVSTVNAGSFTITFQTTGGTATDAPVFNFAVIKAVTA